MKIENLQQIVRGSESRQGVSEMPISRAFLRSTSGWYLGGTECPCFSKTVWSLPCRLQKENL